MRRIVAALTVGVFGLGLLVHAQSAPTPLPSHAGAALPAVMTTGDQAALVGRYCATCHSERNRSGELVLAGFDVTFANEHPETVEKMIRKLRAGMMPPAGAARPDEPTIAQFASALEARMDARAAADPNPGWRPFQRLSRAEYQRAVKELLELDVDVTPFLPPDTLSHGFDNLAESQSFSPALLQGYLRAASQISRLAIGDRHAAATSATYRVPATESQMRTVPGAPFGSRGGVSVVHTFPADGTYTFALTLVRSVSGELFGNTAILMSGKNELIEVLINGERAAVLEVDKGMGDEAARGLTVKTPPIQIKAGPQRVTAAFVPHAVGPVDDLIAPIDQTLIDTRIGTGFGVTALPHLDNLTIMGPIQVTGVSETPSRKRIFSCRPTTAEQRCATQIIQNLGTRAYRGPLAAADLDQLMKFYEQGRKEGDFESGIQMAVQAVLANPRFLFRVEPVPAAAAAPYRLGDLDLASRLSFFLWGTVPDAELQRAANEGALTTRAGLEKQVRRLLADRRSETLSTRFWSQWLRLQDMDNVRPDGVTYPQWDSSLTASFRRETELFFDNLVREDRNILEMLTADYTFVDERLARHYGFGSITGPQFRRVALPENRHGILTQGSILLLTSVADRTSPVQRGKWVMQVLLGAPPPPPPPNVPTLENTKAVADGRVLTVRQRMEQHRANPACASCHRVIDPIGLSLENFDVTGQYRIKDNGTPVDASGQLYDGTSIDGASGLVAALLKRKTTVLTSFTESLMTYALGRRVEYFDLPTVRAIVADAARHEYHASSFIMGIVNSSAFRMSRPPPVEATAAAQRQP
jgi:hypothetical protein